MKQFIMALLLCTSSICHSQITKWTEYQSPNLGFKVKYPENWLKQNPKNGEGVIFYTDANLKESVSGVLTIIVNDTKATSLAADRSNFLSVASEAVKLTNGVKSTKILKAEKARFAGNEKWEIEYTVLLGKKDIAKCVHWFIENNNKLYEISFIGEYFETGREVLGTFSLTSNFEANISNGDKSVNNSNLIGSIASNAKYIDADELGKFENGFAIIRKGTRMGILNSNGDQILPYGEYKPPILLQEKFINGFMILQNIRSDKGAIQGFVNRQGKLTWLPLNNYIERPFNKDGKAIVRNGRLLPGNPNYYYVIDTFGKPTGRYLSEKEFYRANQYVVGEDLVPFSMSDTKNGKILFGFVDYFGKVIIEPKYNKVERFSEGLAAVCKPDEYGVEKWGFINTKGETIIPFTYSIMPEAFSDGLALVFPKDNTEFFCAYIDKTNRIVLKLTTKEAYTSYNPSQKEFKKGYCIWSYYGESHKYIDTAGNRYSDKEIAAKYKASFNVNDYIHLQYPNGASGKIFGNKLYFEKTELSDETLYRFAYIDLVTGVSSMIPASRFDNPIFDGVSKLARTSHYIGKDSAGKPAYRYGYVNEQGIFMIVKKEAGTW